MKKIIDNTEFYDYIEVEKEHFQGCETQVLNKPTANGPEKLCNRTPGTRFLAI